MRRIGLLFAIIASISMALVIAGATQSRSPLDVGGTVDAGGDRRTRALADQGRLLWYLPLIGPPGASPPPSATPKPTRTPSATPTPRTTATRTPSVTPSATPTATATHTPSPTWTLSVTPTSSPSPTSTHTPTATPTLPPLPPSPGLRIGYLLYEGDDEAIKIVNYGVAPQVMTDWLIHSTSADEWYRFPGGYVLGGGEWVIVHSGPGAGLQQPPHLTWKGALVWPDSGGEARLLTADGAVVDTWAY